LSDFLTKPIKLVDRHILGSASLPRSILFYTSDGIFEHINRKDEKERKAFADIFSAFLANSTEMNKEYLKPLAEFSPPRMLELVKEYCLFVLDNDGTQNIGSQPAKQPMIVQAQLKDKSSKIASIIKFFQLVGQYYSLPNDVMFLLLDCTEKLTFANLLRSELQKNETTNSSFLRNVFLKMHENQAKGLDAFSEEASSIAFFTHISHLSDIIPQMIDFQRRVEMTPNSLRIMFDLIVPACYFFQFVT